MVNKRIRVLTLLIIMIVALATVAACRPKDGGGGRRAGTERQSRKETAKNRADKALADKAVANLGSERAAALAVLFAWDRGYSFNQIIKAVREGSLGPRGKIDGAAPAGEAQNYLLLSARPVLLAAAELTITPMKIEPAEKAEIGDVIEAQKAAWTAWILGV